MSTKAKQHRELIFSVTATEAKVLQQEGKWVDNPHYIPDDPDNPPKIFKAMYGVLWRPYNMHPPYSDDDRCVITQIGEDGE